MKTQVIELYKEILIDGLAGAGIDPKDKKLKYCKKIMSIVYEMPIDIIEDLEDIFVMAAYKIYLHSYWETDENRWNLAVSNITNGIAEMKKILERLEDAA